MCLPPATLTEAWLPRPPRLVAMPVWRKILNRNQTFPSIWKRLLVSYIVFKHLCNVWSMLKDEENVKYGRTSRWLEPTASSYMLLLIAHNGAKKSSNCSKIRLWSASYVVLNQRIMSSAYISVVELNQNDKISWFIRFPGGPVQGHVTLSCLLSFSVLWLVMVFHAVWGIIRLIIQLETEILSLSFVFSFWAWPWDNLFATGKVCGAKERKGQALSTTWSDWQTGCFYCWETFN